MPRKKTVQTSDTIAVNAAPPLKRSTRVPLVDPEALAKRFKDYPAIDVLSRRFTNPNDPGSAPILLKDEDPHACTNSDHINRLKPGATVCEAKMSNGRPCGKPARIWYVRWFNLAADGRFSQMKAKGYLRVERDELMDENEIADLDTRDRFVRRGDSGKEILGKMPLELHTYVKSVQRQAWNKTALSPKKVKASLAEQAGEELGDEAGQTVHDEIQVERAIRHRASMEEESEAMPIGAGEVELGSR